MFHRSSAVERRGAFIAAALVGGLSLVALAPSLWTAPTPIEQAALQTPAAPEPLVRGPLPLPLPPERGPGVPLTTTTENAAAVTVLDELKASEHAWLAWPGEELPIPPARQTDDRRPVHEVQVAAGDTLLGLLTRLGIGRAEAHAAVDGLKDVYDPRRLQPGQRLQVETDAAAAALVRLEFEPNMRERIELVRVDDGAFRAQRVAKPTKTATRFIEAEVATSFHAAGLDADIPNPVTGHIIKLFSWDVDFQRETRPGDSFAVLFEQDQLADGTAVSHGDVLYARLATGGRVLEAFRFQRDGAPEYFDRNGRSLRKFLLRTPVSGARISSRFGMRRHPILGYTRMHRGVDFAAPTGTPILAAGSGRLVRVGRLGGYGKYIRINHGNGYETAYAHMSRFADGMRSGRRVRQGEIIGYVGSTGRSTGPHLHFEVLKGGRQVNPLDIAQPPAERLAGDVLVAFEQLVASTETRLATLRSRKVADGRASRNGDDASDG